MLLLLLNYVVLRALWKIYVYLISTLLIKSLLLIFFYFIDCIPPNIVLTYAITVVDTNSFDVSVCPSYLFLFVFLPFKVPIHKHTVLSLFMLAFFSSIYMKIYFRSQPDAEFLKY